ncbi:hypothetical protein INT45_003259 [Circinella minor]|uniref:C2H2-type domain-containing protein n=1 Tax=Circinella minor TaxID=1195481 RepID=A0A8H7S7G9_9FUNG|nr:hypothetical protein INT45_003259 [Circinella minor]
MTDYTSPTLLTRRQQNAGYFHQLDLPSLPPLSQLLTTDRSKVNNNNNNTATATQAAVAAAVQQQQQQAAVAASVATTSTALSSSASSTSSSSLSSSPTTSLSYGVPVNIATSAPNSVYYDYPPTTTTTTSNAAGADAAQVMAAAAVGMTTAPTTTITTHPHQQTTDMLTTAAMMDPMTATHPLFPTTATPAQLTTNDPSSTTMIPGSALGYIDPTTQRVRHPSESSASSADKIYSFVAIPGTNQKKRPRRRYDEIERLYHCNWPGCTKSYGTLNHLNAHVSMQKHGAKRHPSEFKEMRKEWRRQKKEREAVKKAKDEAFKQQQEHIYQQQEQVMAAAAAAMVVPPQPITTTTNSSLLSSTLPQPPQSIPANTFQLHHQAYNQLHPSMAMGAFY